MEPFSIISTPEQLAALRIDAIVCPPRQPGLAYRKTRADLYVTFESPKEWDNRETWTILTMHCQDDAPEAWVLWDPAATIPEPLMPSSWTSIIPGRRPVKKAHTSPGYAKAAVSHQMYAGVAREDMVIQELNPATSKFDTLFSIPKGTLKSQLPW